MKQIESKDNPRFKEIVRIRQHHAKDPESGIFIEGLRLCMDALMSGVVFETVILSHDFTSQIAPALFGEMTEIVVLADSLFEKLCSTDHPQGIAAIVKSPVLFHSEDLVIHPQDKFLLCESIQDPGNLGSIIRSADAFGFTGLLFTHDTVDPFNEKVLRSSTGSIFHIKLFHIGTMAKTILHLKKNGVMIYATHLKGDEISKDWHFQLPCAIIMGNEGQGISEETAKCCDHLIRIPMAGRAESLNVSNAAAILCYLASMQDQANNNNHPIQK